MAAKKTPSTVKTLQARPKVAAKKATVKPAGGTRKATAKKTASRSAGVGAPPKKTSWDVLRLFMQAYEDL